MAASMRAAAAMASLPDRPDCCTATQSAAKENSSGAQSNCGAMSSSKAAVSTYLHRSIRTVGRVCFLHQHADL